MIATRISPLANKYYHICFLFQAKRKKKWDVGCWQTLALQDARVNKSEWMRIIWGFKEKRIKGNV